MTSLLKRRLLSSLVCMASGLCLLSTGQAANWVPFGADSGLYVDTQSIYIAQSKTGDDVAGIWYRANANTASDSQLAWQDTLVLTNCTSGELKIADVVDVDRDGNALFTLSQSAQYDTVLSSKPFYFFAPKAEDQQFADLLSEQCAMRSELIDVMDEQV